MSSEDTTKRQQHHGKPGGLEAFLARTDPLVLSAMRKTTRRLGEGKRTPEETAALNRWFAERVPALVERLALAMEEGGSHGEAA